MIFFRILLVIFFVLANSIGVAEDNNKPSTEEIIDQAKEITKQLQQGDTGQEQAEQAQQLQDEDEDVPLNDPFLGNEGGSSSSANMNIPEEEKEDDMSLYNFKLAGLISGKEHSYISLVDASGDILTLSLGQNLGKIKLIDLRLTEAIFEKIDPETKDKSYLIINFNNKVRAANEY